MAERPFDLTLDPVIAYEIAKLAREYDRDDTGCIQDEKFGDELISDETKILEKLSPDQADPIATELSSLINDLNIDAQRDLLALLWVGRGDYSADQWSDARHQARETSHMHVASYLEQTPLACEYLVDGLTELGYPESEYADA